MPNESFGAYAPGGPGGRDRVFGDLDRKRVREVLTRVMDEMDDCESSNGMYFEYAKIVNFVLANRRITEQRAETPSPFTYEDMVRIWTRDIPVVVPSNGQILDS